MRNAHCRTWHMARKLTNDENEIFTWQDKIWQETLKNVQNEKHTLQDLEYGEKIDNLEK